jgi:acetyl/propionyl-CoA carboxylase alpha subunit
VVTIRRLLIANRGEIAVRIIRACRERGVETVAVYSQADASAQHVALADRAVAIGAAPSVDSYLSFEKILEAARSTDADAIHPGYGFLSQNAMFAEACESARVRSCPSAAAIRAMGSKIERGASSARRACRSSLASCRAIRATQESRRRSSGWASRRSSRPQPAAAAKG